MANLKSAIKRAQVSEKKRKRNQYFRTKMRSQIKLVEALVEANDVEQAKSAYQGAIRKIDKTVQKGIIHKNNGNRQKSRLAKMINKMES